MSVIIRLRLNQLIAAIIGDQVTYYRYNGEGLRVEKESDENVSKYLYEYDKVNSEGREGALGYKIVLEVDGKGNQIARNIYGINLLTRTVEGQTFYYMYNGHADVTALIDKDGEVHATYYYDAFGNITEQTGDVNNNITYAGYQYDEEIGLYYLNARMYDPIISRFLQEDTYRGNRFDPLSLNLYTYVHNEPIMYWDPTGHVAMRSLADHYGGYIEWVDATKTATFIVNEITMQYKVIDGNVFEYRNSSVGSKIGIITNGRIDVEEFYFYETFNLYYLNTDVYLNRVKEIGNKQGHREALQKIMNDVTKFEQQFRDDSFDNLSKLYDKIDSLVDKIGSVDEEMHYFRNKLNRAPATLKEMEAINTNGQWKRYSTIKNSYHMHGAGDISNVKYVGADGRFEAIYNRDGVLLTEENDPVNMSTYNYSLEKHYDYDVVPYFKWNNTRDLEGEGFRVSNMKAGWNVVRYYGVEIKEVSNKVVDTIAEGVNKIVNWFK